MHSTALNLKDEQFVFSKVAKTRPKKRVYHKKSSQILIVSGQETPTIFPGHGMVTQSTIDSAPQHLTTMRPDIILIAAGLDNQFGKYLCQLKTYGRVHAVPLVLYSSEFSVLNRNIAMKFGFDEYYFGDFTNFTFKKIKFYKKLKACRTSLSKRIGVRQSCSRKINFLKRVIDIALSLIMLTILSPLFIVIAALIKLESKGPVFYISKRAGFGYRIFNFYKFRSMRVNADKEMDLLRQHNQYGNSAFFKMRNDPRITRLGNFLRCTSIDELPQLINVLKGDMSLVGNRPLPLYEAEHLTKEKIAGRFLAPAGITGLWQITKRGKSDMTESERIKLDITYAKKWSVWFDLKILFKTLPALLQKEPV